jgi:hypothetical protein
MRKKTATLDQHLEELLRRLSAELVVGQPMLGNVSALQSSASMPP